METKNQRATLVVDVQNLFYSVRDIHGKLARIDFGKLYKKCAAKFDLINASAYVAIGSVEQTRPFCEFMKKVGFEVVSSQIKVEDKKIYATDWDVGITVNVIRKLDDFDVLILASGDGDFRHLIDYIHEKEKKCVVIGFEKELSRSLQAHADDVIYLTEEDIFFQPESDRPEEVKK